MFVCFVFILFCLLAGLLDFSFLSFFGITNHFANCNRNIKFTILFEFINHWVCSHANASKVEFVSDFSFHHLEDKKTLCTRHFAIWNTHTRAHSIPYFFCSHWMCSFASFNPFNWSSLLLVSLVPLFSLLPYILLLSMWFCWVFHFSLVR